MTAALSAFTAPPRFEACDGTDQSIVDEPRDTGVPYAKEPIAAHRPSHLLRDAAGRRREHRDETAGCKIDGAMGSIAAAGDDESIRKELHRNASAIARCKTIARADSSEFVQRRSGIMQILEGRLVAGLSGFEGWETTRLSYGAIWSIRWARRLNR